MSHLRAETSGQVAPLRTAATKTHCTLDLTAGGALPVPSTPVLPGREAAFRGKKPQVKDGALP
jgi:hypothetical protein